MEHFDKATLDRFVESMTPIGQQNNENKVFPTISNDEIKQNVNPIPQMPPPKKISMTSSNDADYDSTPKPTMLKNNINNIRINSDSEPGQDDPIELTAMRETLQYLVHTEARKSGVNIDISQLNEQPKYGDDPDENVLITLMNQQSLKNVIQTATHRSESSIHPAVQKLYEQQQNLLEKLQLLEKDDPDPHSAKLWNIMQKIFTEENAQQRQQNIEDLTNTLDKKHREVTIVKNQNNNNGNDKLLLKSIQSIHELSKETNNELKEMRQQLNEERKTNQELRNKIKKKNKQLKMLSSKQLKDNIIDENDSGYIAPIAYDPNTINGNNRNHKHHNNNQLSLDSIDTEYSVNDDENKEMNTFQNWCVNMGFQTSKTSCSWF